MQKMERCNSHPDTIRTREIFRNKRAECKEATPRVWSTYWARIIKSIGGLHSKKFRRLKTYKIVLFLQKKTYFLHRLKGLDFWNQIWNQTQPQFSKFEIQTPKRVLIQTLFQLQLLTCLYIFIPIIRFVTLNIQTNKSSRPNIDW